MALEFASRDLQGDPIVVAAALASSQGKALKFVGSEWKQNPPDLVLALRGLVLAHDRDFILALLRDTKETPTVMLHISEELKNDPEIVMMAVQQRASSLRFVGNKPSRDMDFPMETISKLPQAPQYAPEDIWDNRHCS